MTLSCRESARENKGLGMSLLKNLAKRFWWALVLVGVAFSLYLRSIQRRARLAQGLQAQRDIERMALEEYQAASSKSRAEKARLNVRLQNSRDKWTQRKAELEAEIATDENGLSNAWNRAFGRDAGAKRTEQSGDE
jgi:cytochrome c biogenesis protein ResB